MTVQIREIVSEVVLAPRQNSLPAGSRRGHPPAIDEELIDAVVRRAAARVMAELRLEWDR